MLVVADMPPVPKARPAEVGGLLAWLNDMKALSGENEKVFAAPPKGPPGGGLFRNQRLWSAGLAKAPNPKQACSSVKKLLSEVGEPLWLLGEEISPDEPRL